MFTLTSALSNARIVELASVIYCFQLWNDDRLRWSPVIYDDTEYIHALEEEIWKPEVLVDNA